VEKHCRFVESGATVIRHDGEVCSCYRLSHNYVEYVMGRHKEIAMYSFGNVMEKSLREILTISSNKYIGIFSSHENI